MPFARTVAARSSQPWRQVGRGRHEDEALGASGWRTAKACAVMPPSDRPTTWAFSIAKRVEQAGEVVGEIVDRDRPVEHLRAAVAARVVAQAAIAVGQRRDLRSHISSVVPTEFENATTGASSGPVRS